MALNLGDEHATTVYQADTMRLAAESLDDNGLLWKVLCKTGTLALSPGPGQVDLDRPLNLTSDIFLGVKDAYDKKAFEHVTIPETHTNSAVENTGTVRALDVLTRDQLMADERLPELVKVEAGVQTDSEDTLYMLGGLHFTEPDIRGKAERGSIINCSCGFKFNYRNKRTGETFPVVLEHVALTNQPWVDGLPAFGSGVGLSAPYDQEDEIPWDGVFIGQLDLADTSTEGRDKSAKKGHALPDGSFPIENVGDLKNAIQAFGRAKDKDAAKRHIVKRAKELGAENLLPDSWNLAQDQRELQLAVITFDPKAHPRDLKGRFRAALGKLKQGDTLRLPDGTSVTRGEANPGYFEIHRPKTKDDAVPRSHKTVLDTTAHTDKSTAKDRVKETVSEDAVAEHVLTVSKSTDFTGKKIGSRKKAHLSQDGATTLTEDDSLDELLHKLTEEDQEMPETKLEELLAQQQAEIERLRQEQESTQAALRLAQGTIVSQGERLHGENVAKKIAAWQEKGIDPAVLLRAEQVMLSAYQPDEDGLNLSISGAGPDGAELNLGVMDLVEWLVDAIPSKPDHDFGQIRHGIHLSQQARGRAQEKGDDSPEAKRAQADQIWAELHPELANSTTSA